MIPQIFIVSDELQVRGQAEMMSVGREQLHAEAVDRAEESAVERLDDFQGEPGLEDALPGALLHLIGGAIGVGDNHELRQAFEGERAAREFDDPIGDRPRLARTGRGDDRKIPIQRAGETFSRCEVGGLNQVPVPPFQ